MPVAMDDRTDQFVVYKRAEIDNFQNRIRDLIRENDKLKTLQHRYHELEFENLDLKRKLTNREAQFAAPATGVDGQSLRNGRDRHLVMDFMHTQEAPDVIPRVAVTPTRSHITDSYSGANHGVNACAIDGQIDITAGIPDSPDGLDIGYGKGLRRQSMFHTHTKHERTSLPANNTNLGEFPRKRLDTAFWAPTAITDTVHEDNNNSSRHTINSGLQELAKHMSHGPNGRGPTTTTGAHTIMLKILVREWNRKPEPMSRTEFFYHTLRVFMSAGALITTCAEHQPPCRPRVDCHTLEANAPVLKSFIKCVNSFKLVVIEVELLAALELLAYAEPRYRPAMADAMDILFRKGVCEAVAFGEWSMADSPRAADKTKLINEIKAAGFNLLRRSPSV